MSKQRLLFVRPVAAQQPGPVPNEYFSIVPPDPLRNLSSMSVLHRLAGWNQGNYVHTEALFHMLDFDRSGSCFFDLYPASKNFSIKDVARQIRDRFDAVIFSTANIVSKGVALTPDIELISNLNIPVYMFGVGIQSTEIGRDDLHSSVTRLLDFMNSEGALLATRGDVTAQKLSDFGVKNVVSLGCPSLYVFPENINRIESPALDQVRSIITAGHITTAEGPGERFNLLHDFIGRIPGHPRIEYVLQDEVFSWNDKFDANAPVYDLARKSFDRDWMHGRFFKNSPLQSHEIPEFRMFFDTSAWRLFASFSDVYIGDRFHGGIICLQAGKPAVIVRNDDRVSELTEKNAIPNVHLRDLGKHSVEQFWEKYLSADALDRMKRVVAQNRASFVSACTARGLTFTQA